jgi:hypothetical protein
MSSSRRVGWSEFIVVLLGFTVVTMIVTLPLWQHPTRRLPSDLIDTLLNTWIIGWDADRLRHGLAGWWDAPILFPYRHTLAFSENLLGIAVFVAPVYWISENAVLTYNVAFTLSFALAGASMYLLATTVTGSRRCGVIGGAFYAFCPFRFVQVSHIQLIATGWLPIALYALHRYFDTPRRRWLIVFAIACGVQVLSNTYMAYFMALPIAVIVVDGLWRTSVARWRTVAELAATGALVLLVLAPFGWQYYQARADYGQVRRLVEMDMGAADVRSYVIGNKMIGMWRWLRADAPVEGERELFPGLTALVLAAIAIGSAVRRDDRRRWVIAYGVMAIAAAVLSMGPHPRAWGHLLMAHGPYEWLLRAVPGMDGMRVPARFAIVFFLGLSVLAAVGARLACDRLPAPLRTPATIVCVALILAESWVVPLPFNTYTARGRPADRGVAQWLRARPAGAVLHEPVKTSNYQELSYQYATLVHGHPIVNGISGYDTPLQMLFRDHASLLYDNDRPSDVVRMLRSLGVRYVVVNGDDYNGAQIANHEDRAMLQLLRESGQVVEERRFLETFAFELAPPIVPAPAEPMVPIDPRELSLSVSSAPDRAASLVDGDRETRWFADQNGANWVTVELSRPCNVARLDIGLAGRTLTDYPRELQIDATDDRGVTRTVYHATPYPEFILGFVKDPDYPRISIALPPNRSTKVTIRETATVIGRWWSVHELNVWRRP